MHLLMLKARVLAIATDLLYNSHVPETTLSPSQSLDYNNAVPSLVVSSFSRAVTYASRVFFWYCQFLLFLHRTKAAWAAHAWDHEVASQKAAQLFYYPCLVWQPVQNNKAKNICCKYNTYSYIIYQYTTYNNIVLYVQNELRSLLYLNEIEVYEVDTAYI
jgi:hypothetical protein